MPILQNTKVLGIFRCSFFFIESLIGPAETSSAKSAVVQLDHGGALIRRQDGDLKVKNIMTPALLIGDGDTRVRFR